MPVQTNQNHSNMKPTTLRSARPADVPGMLAIYAPFVLHTAVSFEMEVPAEDDFLERVSTVQREAPWLVAEKGDTITGYAYAAPHRSRYAYRWTREVSAYVHPDYRGNGVGRALYTALFELLRRQGYTNTLAGITLPNDASVAFHEKIGFTTVGVYHRVGYKMDRYHDVGWWERPLSEEAPGAIRPPAELGLLR